MRLLQVGLSAGFGVGLLVFAGCSSSPSQSKEANPQTVMNEFCELLLTADGRAKAPIDVAAHTPGPAAEPGLPVGLSPGDAAQLVVEPRGTGVFTAVADQPGVFRVACDEFDPGDDLFQTRGDLCWVSAVRMFEDYVDEGPARAELQILQEVRGDEAVAWEEGQNFGNVYEIVRALNPDLQDYGREIAYFALSGLSLENASNDELLGYGLLQAQRFLDQFMGAEAMLSSLAAGQPVIVGLNRPIPEAERSDGGPQTFGHALVLHEAEFVLIPEDESKEMTLHRTEAAVDGIVDGRDLWNKLARAGSGEVSTVDQAKGIGQGLWDGAKKTWNNAFSGDDEIDRPYRLALRKVHLFDPLGQRDQYPKRIELDAATFRDQFKFAINRDKARSITPILDPGELEAVFTTESSASAQP